VHGTKQPTSRAAPATTSQRPHSGGAHHEHTQCNGMGMNATEVANHPHSCNATVRHFNTHDGSEKTDARSPAPAKTAPIVALRWETTRSNAGDMDTQVIVDEPAWWRAHAVQVARGRATRRRCADVAAAGRVQPRLVLAVHVAAAGTHAW
jgi:hypothetical protein